jgi:hypothetical protein
VKAPVFDSTEPSGDAIVIVMPSMTEGSPREVESGARNREATSFELAVSNTMLFR